MTQPIESGETRYVSLGLTAPVAIGFRCASATEVVVEWTPAGGELVAGASGTDFTITGDLLAGAGYVNWISGREPPLDAEVRFWRSTAAEQADSMGDLMVWRPAVAERSFDRIIRLVQEILRDLTNGVYGGGDGGGGGGGASVTWSTLAGKPGTFPPSAHTQAISTITGLTEALEDMALGDLSNVSDAVLRAAIIETGVAALVFPSSEAGQTIPALADRKGKVLGFHATTGAVIPMTLPVTGGLGTGDVDSVNGQSPDGAGNVTLIPSHIGAASVDLSDTSFKPVASAQLMSAPAILNRQLSLLKFIPYAKHSAILDFSAAESHSAYIQAALDEALARGGAEILVEEGRFRTTTPLLVPSKTVLRGKGLRSQIQTLTASWTSGALAGTGYDYAMFLNKNWNAGSLTDEAIGLDNVTLDHLNLNGAAHLWLMRRVDRPFVRHATLKNGGSAVAMLATRDSHIQACHATNMANCFYDHWDGFSGAQVIGCFGRGAGNQGIQFTGTGTAFEDRSSTVSLAMGNQIYDVLNTNPATPYSTGLIANVVDAGSSNFRLKSIGNYIENCDNGIVFAGDGGQHESHGDTIRNVLQAPVMIQDEGGGEVPNACVIDGITLIDCDHAAGNPALISIGGGARHSVRGMKIENPAARSWDYQVWLSSTVTGATIHPIDGPVGVTGTGKVLDQGTGNTVQAYGGSPDVVRGSDGSGAYTDFFSPNHSYRARIRDAGSLNFNAQIQAATSLNATTDISLGGSGVIAFGAGAGYWIQKLGADCYWREPSGPSIVKMN